MMSDERLFSLRNVWFTASVGALAGLIVVAAAIGFLWIPLAQGEKNAAGLWNAICTAAGVPLSSRRVRQPTTPAAIPSDVIVTAQLMKPADSHAIARGAALAVQCAGCHGAPGVSPAAGSPALAGQFDAATYKQLRDFKSGHRKSAIMEPLAAGLGDPDMRDLAAYYSELAQEGRAATASAEAPVIVRNGSPMRNIAACAACHGGIDGKTGTPRLDRQPEAYLLAQLQAFASGARRNDIQEQMRNVTRQMTPEEMGIAARYYAAR